MKAGGLVDRVDAGMGACMHALELAGTAEWPLAAYLDEDGEWDDADRPSRARHIEDGWFGDIYSAGE
jgi:hypothetical protein